MIHLRHKNILSIKDIFIDAKSDIYLVTDLLSTDLSMILSKSKLEEDYVTFFLFQLLCGINYLHLCDVIHWFVVYVCQPLFCLVVIFGPRIYSSTITARFESATLVMHGKLMTLK